MSEVVLYITRSGHSKKLAEMLSRELGAVLYEIGDTVDRRGLIGYLRTGYQASTKKATAIKDPGVDLKGIDTVVLVQPIWASGVCPPVRTWLLAHQSELKGKKIALLASNLGSPAERLKANFESEFGPLAAFDVIPQREAEENKATRVAAFVKSLKLA